MKSRLSTWLILTLLGLSASGLASDTAETIVGKIEASLAPRNVKFVYEFTNYRSDNSIMVYEVRFDMRDVNHSRGYFMKPEREKGREMLRVDDNLWTYVPSVGRIVRMADRDSFAGGDFSNADILRIDWLSKYDAKIIKDLPKQWIIELLAKIEKAPYAKMRLWVDKTNYQPVQQHYYDSKSTLLKKCRYGSIKKYGDIERPSHLLMENVITRQKSELKILDWLLAPSLPDSLFIPDNLGK